MKSLCKMISSINGLFYEYRWLSNYQECDILYNGLVFKNTEATYQAAKHSNIEQMKIYQNVTNLETKKHSKQFAIKSSWYSIKKNIMSEISISKVFT